jgi:hypothetical protein
LSSNSAPDDRADQLPIVMVSIGGIPVLLSAFLFSFAIMVWCANRNEYARVKTMIEMQKKEELV